MCFTKTKTLYLQEKFPVRTRFFAKRNIPRVKLEADENENAIVDKNEHPEIYD